MAKKKSEKKDDAPSKKEIEHQNKLIRNFLIVSGIVFVSFLGVFLIANAMKNFDYRGVEVTIVDEIAPYRFSLQVSYQGEVVPYYFYLRNDPRNLEEEVVFDGTLDLKENVVINGTSFNCDGDGAIGMANLLNLYKIIGADVIKDENATCDEEGRYMFIQMQEGDETKITQYGPACYLIEISDCEILKATERFMIESFVVIDERLG